MFQELSFMKKIIAFLLIVSLSVAVSALADPFALLDDCTGSIVVQYDENDLSAGRFEYSYRFPQVDGDAEGGAAINAFYLSRANDLESFTIPMDQNTFWGPDMSTVVDYRVTCNNDEFFSVLIRKEKRIGERTAVTWEGHVFSREHPNPGSTYTLPKFLNILDPEENEEWVQELQNENANTVVRQLVWNMIQENENGIDYDPDYTEEYLAEDFNPEEEYYLDENGAPVFYINPGVAAPDEVGLLIFPISLEDILDEL